MATKRIGGMAQQSLLVSQMAEQMQAQAVAYIAGQYANEDEKQFDITNMTLDDLIARVEQAVKDGTLEQLNAQLAAQLAPMLLAAAQGQAVQ